MTAAGLHELFTARAVEYLIAVAYLLAFIPFWRFVRSSAAAAEVAAAEEPSTGWFRVPEGFGFHPGHAWVRADAGNVVTVGLDDFARSVVGPIAGVTLPGVGAKLREGHPAWTVHGLAGALPMIAPTDGEVVEVNRGASLAPGRIEKDPYGEGWLLRVRRTEPATSGASMFSGARARAWMEEVASKLQSSFAPELGPVAADGGTPVHGIGVGLSSEDWDRLVQDFFLSPATGTQEGAPGRTGSTR